MGVGKGWAELTSASAANTFKMKGILRAPLQPKHEPGHFSGDLGVTAAENLSPN